ncbi:transcriptional regulator [Candidatus Rickettsiella isopodorum]|jgi:glycine cleavage system transcriptional repressor|uniref:Glycine cleavage system transcriptional repressor n=1 Tax=Candidatus Rickettsiella isopodorum TaxID=1225476 RepID=A0A1J8P3I8_9COXI|nr:ACT domain-containing protein [Candidatus Rickettsiella isopodorum]MCH9636899.1 transcriptional regulator [Gammaproteobacteria bacterium]MDQ5900039.1 Glycine cleavage system transcriptional repressor [Pseudomonadota bacterium]MCH9754394.1 transcriptional regulator [Gammaproteobacteria bacterium]MDD4892912.1 transcriptional regulator [Candidatus Rickettsiella isopodorum]MDD5161564.1 transcriptional regulator [Candidatus Rickettsiella isopodorum]
MENLVVVVLGLNENQLTDQVFRMVAHSGCHIVDARVNTTAKHVTMTLLIGGAWNTIARFETLIKKFEGHVLVERTQVRSAQPDNFPYSSYIVAPDIPNVLAKITHFLSEQQVTLYNLHIESYKAPITEAAMLGISLSFGFPAQPPHLVADFREHFIVFCDEHNFDVAMEPQKN